MMSEFAFFRFTAFATVETVATSIAVTAMPMARTYEKAARTIAVAIIRVASSVTVFACHCNKNNYDDD